jgi:hypothetical protein
MSAAFSAKPPPLIHVPHMERAGREEKAVLSSQEAATARFDQRIDLGSLAVPPVSALPTRATAIRAAPIFLTVFLGVA